MAARGNWVVIFEDKRIIKNIAEGANGGLGFVIDDDDAFWNDAKFSNIWALQYGTSNASDEVEHRDETPNCTYAEANLGDFSQFTDKWDAKYLVQIQAEWDDNGVVDETAEEKIARLGPGPTSYSS